MKIRNRILIYFLSTVITLTVISLSIVYILFSEYREEGFQQRQNEKINYTIGLITEYKELSENLSAIMDKHTIHDFYDEKMLIFDKNKELIYKSVDDLTIRNYQQLLNELSPNQTWIETKEDKYDIVAVYVQNEFNHFYAISKAYDAFGYLKLDFLRNMLILITCVITVIVVVITTILSKRISKPITLFAEKVGKYDVSGSRIKELEMDSSTYELQFLTQKFNQLIERTNEAFAFQKHTIHHISHQLKTPIAVLVSELERINSLEEKETIKAEIASQVVRAKSLGNIINVLLEISKIESGQKIQKRALRIDELFFDVIEELGLIYPDFHFEVNYVPDEVQESRLVLYFNNVLIRQAIQNLLTNCVYYSDNSKAKILFDCSDNKTLTIKIINSGKPISKEEEKFLFNHFFRGENSKDKKGFGLGLVLVKRIIELSSGKVSYTNPTGKINEFEINFPLS
ncbi:hypothetical protein GCM10011506_01780 [Marivirga lumbricoides]|uniref:histidine kinase n=1 Tax=Marivirga lumbricoides TaxID=1046115 RepID=A0ABQ1L8I0_9BACT|nr:hypothetical protein GCM10011506_01780 [Marivirga lumbricoides]